MTRTLPSRRVDLSGRPRGRAPIPWGRGAALLAALGGVLAVAALATSGVPAPSGAITSVRLDADVGPGAAGLLAPPAAAPALPAAPAPAAAPPPQPSVAVQPVAPSPTDADLVPVLMIREGDTLWDLGVRRVGRDVPTVIRWIRTMQRLNGLDNPHRIEPGPLVAPEADPLEPVFMRRQDVGAPPP